MRGQLAFSIIWVLCMLYVLCITQIPGEYRINCITLLILSISNYEGLYLMVMCCPHLLYNSIPRSFTIKGPFIAACAVFWLRMYFFKLSLGQPPRFIMAGRLGRRAGGATPGRTGTGNANTVLSKGNPVPVQAAARLGLAPGKRRHPLTSGATRVYNSPHCAA